jgi:hypothetical protein
MKISELITALQLVEQPTMSRNTSRFSLSFRAHKQLLHEPAAFQ